MNIKEDPIVTSLPPESVSFPGYVLYDPMTEKYLTYSISHALEDVMKNRHYNIGWLTLDNANLIPRFKDVEDAQGMKATILENLSGGEIRAAVARTVIRRAETVITVL